MHLIVHVVLLSYRLRAVMQEREVLEAEQKADQELDVLMEDLSFMLDEG